MKLWKVEPAEWRDGWVKVTWQNGRWAERPTVAEAKRAIARAWVEENFTEEDYDRGYDEAEVDLVLAEMEEEAAEEDTETAEIALEEITRTHSDNDVVKLAETLLLVLKLQAKRDNKRGKRTKF